MADIEFTSKDLAKVKRLHRKFPRLLESTFPATAREETKNFRRNIKLATRAAGWSTKFRFGGSPPADVTTVKTKKFKEFKELGISILPRFGGIAALYQHGSKGHRKRKSGGNTGIMPANPVWNIEFDRFRGSGKNEIQQSFIKATMRSINREIRKAGLK